ncbi:TPA: hypothetical protein DDW69_00070 [candidate division CPR2 bacterium]|uniref:Conserved TM helix repeat-containing protein n=1 Tax=candidate division CPR2 bacterium GW2011_GWC1_41_48 TaxID=1618344 RepID=A0A0G0W9K9_UNCC2|nr:MAG: Conserved TM helix repeat-containing protein [candidate division CPR2 bacterium GW2011_GWC2_39_35]KKR27607.1 MAG: Conserved TM helix repeat-containing protein [candidate division CPR2 bacterium GW2011_GWD1_39_7]KKR28245.1 MAG: Conserved TM helix repeat-containing protein [candidate division CPR2 bacterium GW2011_GWD2_39_7]KKS08742.1 MAG: Conserved TM helix repeat-containing protein [candidate division CPR2 bacterium GW2011_GWC1_41_48]OGB58969.1 MAG: hypothetical protein A2Y27_02295 [can
MQAISWNEVATRITDRLAGVISYIPNVIGALVIILIGILVGWAFKTLIVRVLESIKLKPYIDKLGLAKVYPAKFDLVEFLGDVAKWIVIIIFLIPALDALNAQQTNELVTKIVGYIPNVVAAIAIIMVVFIIADLVSRAIEGTVATIGAKSAKLLADVARWTIIILAVLAGAQQLGIESSEDIIKAIAFGLAATFAIAFGFGGQDFAKEILSRFRKNLPK